MDAPLSQTAVELPQRAQPNATAASSTSLTSGGAPVPTCTRPRSQATASAAAGDLRGEEEVDPGDAGAAERLEDRDRGVHQRLALDLGDGGGQPELRPTAVLRVVVERSVAPDLEGGW